MCVSIAEAQLEEEPGCGGDDRNGGVGDDDGGGVVRHGGARLKMGK